MDWITSPESWIALATLTLLEIVLGVDNIIMISILSDKLPPERREMARKLGLAIALVARVALLFSLAWLIGLTEPLFSLLGQPFSGRDLILVAGGLFLLAKAVHEIHGNVEGETAPEHAREQVFVSMAGVLSQIVAMDLVFSLDSVITAVGMADELGVMVTAVVVAIGVMIVLIGPISRFVGRHPTVKILALSFLLLIGVTLLAEGLGQHFPKGYIYFAFGFSIFVEALNLRMKEKRGSRAAEAATS